MKTVDSSKNILPSFFCGSPIVSKDTLLSVCKSYVTEELKGKKINCLFGSIHTPVLHTTKKIKEIIQKNDFDKIREVEINTLGALKPIYEHLIKNKMEAWGVFIYHDMPYFFDSSEHGLIWVRPVEKTSVKNGILYEIEQGIYVEPDKMVGIARYEILTDYDIENVIFAGLLAYVLSDIMGSGLAIDTSLLSSAFERAATELGFEINLEVDSFYIGMTTSSLVFLVSFMGIDALWNAYNLEDTVKLQIYNWEDGFWEISQCYRENVVFVGKDNYFSSGYIFYLGYSDPQMPQVPLFIKANADLVANCSFNTVIMSGAFMKRFGISLEFIRSCVGGGFMWAFKCPDSGNNKQAASDGIKDLTAKMYYEKAKWNDTPLSFSFKTTYYQIPVLVGLDYLNGPRDGHYNAMINICDVS